MIEKLLKSTLRDYGCSDAIIEEFWREIAKQHSSRMRHYHTLHHLDHMILQLQEVREGNVDDFICTQAAFH